MMIEEKFPHRMASQCTLSKEKQHLDPGSSVGHARVPPSSFSHVLIVWAGLAGAVMGWLPSEAAAHVKWFASTDVGESPLSLAEVASPLFWGAVVLACAVLLTATLLEQTTAARRLSGRIESVTSPVSAKVEQILRVAVGAFFVSLWARGGVLLTPELLTDSAAIAWLQFVIAASMLDRRLLPLGAVGILGLYGEGVRQHGLFHMIDYIFFPGLACYLGLSAAAHPAVQAIRMPAVRISLAFSLMWVGIEKLVYPHWTMAIMAQHPVITFGLEPDVVTQIAAIVEFSLAFALLWTPVIRRLAALILAMLMSVAILEFGKIDAIGHMIPIALLLATALDHSRFPRLRSTLSPVLLSGSLAVVFTWYQLAHAIG